MRQRKFLPAKRNSTGAPRWSAMRGRTGSLFWRSAPLTSIAGRRAQRGGRCGGTLFFSRRGKKRKSRAIGHAFVAVPTRLLRRQRWLGGRRDISRKRVKMGCGLGRWRASCTQTRQLCGAQYDRLRALRRANWPKRCALRDSRVCCAPEKTSRTRFTKRVMARRAAYTSAATRNWV